jgi:hypothetical protein
LCDINHSFFCIFNFGEVELGSVEVSVVSNFIFSFVFAFFYAFFFGVNRIRVEVKVGVE